MLAPAHAYVFLLLTATSVAYQLVFQRWERLRRAVTNNRVPDLLSIWTFAAVAGLPLGWAMAAIVIYYVPDWNPRSTGKGPRRRTPIWLLDIDGSISAVQAAERVYRTASGTRPEGEYGNLLDQVLTVITQAWGQSSKGVDRHILEGLAQLYGRFEGGIDSAKLITDLQKQNPVQLLGKAKLLQAVQGGRVPAAMAKVLVGIHNNRKRTNLLPEWVWTR